MRMLTNYGKIATLARVTNGVPITFINAALDIIFQCGVNAAQVGLKQRCGQFFRVVGRFRCGHNLVKTADKLGRLRTEYAVFL